MKRNIYKWHRISSLIIAVPVLLWAFSGFLHPVMTNIRPKIATQEFKPVAIDNSKIKSSLQKALQLNHIDSFHNVKIIHIDTSWFYQVQNAANTQIDYLSVTNGKRLKRGDWLYAQYLARIFLEGEPKRDSVHKTASAENQPLPDCCDAAAVCVLNPATGAIVKDVAIVTSFDDVYQSVNRILPAYKVSFEREDGIRIYVETTHDRFVFAADNNRAAFSKFFSMVHTWGWLRFLGKGKFLVELFFVGLAFLTTLMGIYIFFTTKSKKIKGNELIKARRNHRYISITVSLFTLMFTFSGFYHAFSKLEKIKSSDPFIQHTFQSSQVDLNIGQLQSIAQKPITNIGLVKLNDTAYWQVYCTSGADKKTAPKDLMLDKGAKVPIPVYINAGSNTILTDGEKKYAGYLATQFSRYNVSAIRSATLIKKFDADYNFADKLLPVWKVSYDTNHNVRYYVETNSGKLSKCVNDRDMYESYSFAFLHKHEFLSGLGKSVKDSSTMFWALAQIVMVTIGLRLWWKKRK